MLSLDGEDKTRKFNTKIDLLKEEQVCLRSGKNPDKLIFNDSLTASKIIMTMHFLHNLSLYFTSIHYV